MKTVTLALFCAVLLLSACSHEAKAPACSPTATVQCPNDYWTHEFRKSQRLQDAADEELRKNGPSETYEDRNDQLRGLVGRLQEMQHNVGKDPGTPGGPGEFKWNISKWWFDRIQQPTMMAPPPPAPGK
jgi:hypothetical protein